jgi:hypothetical protein
MAMVLSAVICKLILVWCFRTQHAVSLVEHRCLDCDLGCNIPRYLPHSIGELLHRHYLEHRHHVYLLLAEVAFYGHISITLKSSSNLFRA